jgi:hypothetical protein
MNQQTAMPSNITLLPRAVALGTGPPTLQFGDITAGGELGAGFRPFVPIATFWCLMSTS